jgi:hypothetical protein
MAARWRLSEDGLHGAGEGEEEEPDTPRRFRGVALVVRAAAAERLPAPAPARTVIAETLRLGDAWVRWARAGHGGDRLQRISTWVAEWGQCSEGLRRLLVARRTQRLVALGGQALVFADCKLEQVQRTKIGRPVFVILSTAAQRAGLFIRPRCPGRDDAGGGPRDSVPADEQERTTACPELGQRPSLPQPHPQTHPHGVSRPALQRVRPALMHRAAPLPPHRAAPDGQNDRVPRTGAEELARTGEDLFKALSVPLAGARQLLFDSIPELASKEEEDDVPRLEALSDEDEAALFAAAGLPTRRSALALEQQAELMLAAGLPAGGRQMSRSNSCASSVGSLQSAARSDGGYASTTGQGTGAEDTERMLPSAERTLSAWLEAAEPVTLAPCVTRAPRRRHVDGFASPDARGGGVVSWINRRIDPDGVRVKAPETPPKDDALYGKFSPADASVQRSPPGVPKLALGRVPAVLRHIEASGSGSVALRQAETPGSTPSGAPQQAPPHRRSRNDTWRSTEDEREDGSDRCCGVGEQRRGAAAHDNPLLAFWGSAGSCVVACLPVDKGDSLYVPVLVSRGLVRSLPRREQGLRGLGFMEGHRTWSFRCICASACAGDADHNQYLPHTPCVVKMSDGLSVDHAKATSMRA